MQPIGCRLFKVFLRNWLLWLWTQLSDKSRAVKAVEEETLPYRTASAHKGEGAGNRDRDSRRWNARRCGHQEDKFFV